MKIKINHHLIYFTIIISLLAAMAQIYYSFNLQPALQERSERQVKIYYNQEVRANELVIDEIQKAEKYVYFAIYTFTRTDIKDALLAAKLRGLDVRGVVDREQTKKLDEQRKIVGELEQAGIKISFQDHSAIMHLKTLVTEKSFVSGSYNWTSSATNLNDEILEIGRDEDLRRQYERVIKTLLDRYNK